MKASPKKRLRRDAKKQAANKARLHQVRTCVKKVHLVLAEKDTKKDTHRENPVEALQVAQSALARAAAKGIIHKNAAARRTSRLAKRLAQK